MCLSLAAFLQLLIAVVVICACIKILQLLIGWVAGKLGEPFADIAGLLTQILMIVFWAAVIIAVILLVGTLLSCLWGSFSLPHFGR